MNHISKLHYAAFLIVLVITFVAAYFIGNFAPALNTSNGSFPDYEGFEDIIWSSVIRGVVSDIQVTDAENGQGSITIQQDVTLPMELYIDIGEGITGVARDVTGLVDQDGRPITDWPELLGVEGISIGDTVRLSIQRQLDNTSDHYDKVVVYSITIE